jgi:hypothetical protein
VRALRALRGTRAQPLTRRRYPQTALCRASPIAVAELARSAGAYCYAVAPQAPVRHAATAAALALPRSGVSVALLASQEAILTLARAVHLGILFAPLILLAPAALLYGYGRDAWMNLLNRTLRLAGPAFIKWGQARGVR